MYEFRKTWPSYISHGSKILNKFQKRLKEASTINDLQTRLLVYSLILKNEIKDIENANFYDEDKKRLKLEICDYYNSVKAFALIQ
jgi:hypothetical protein